MHNRFKTVFALLSLSMLFMVLPGTLRSAQVSSFPSFVWGKGLAGLTVTQTSSGFDLTWGWSGSHDPNSYDVTVTNLTTSTQLYSNNTSNKYITITGLSYSPGDTLRFSVSVTGGGLIIEDVVM